MEIKAEYRNGEFNPLTKVVSIEEGEVVDLIIKKNIKNLRFVGMWKDRTDINSGVDYVRKVRAWDRIN